MTTQADLADALGVGRSNVSNWFTRDTELSWAQVRRIDSAMAAGGAYEDMVRGLTTPDALEPAKTWEYNPQGAVGPHWMWLRPAEDNGRPFTATVRIGPFYAEYSPPPGPIGGMVWAAAAPTNPATVVELSRPGWADAGRGRPPEAVGVPITDIVQETRLLNPSLTHALQAGASLLDSAGRDRPRWLQELAEVTGAPLALLQEAVKYAKTMSPVPQRVPSGEPSPAWDSWSGPRYAALRSQRRFSQQDVVDQLAQDTHPLQLAKPTLNRFEHGAAVGIPLLGARLDRLYGADGRTGYWPIDVRRADGESVVEFPEWWVGPIWLRFQGSGNATITLEWSPWQKSVDVRSGGVLTTRRSEQGSRGITVRGRPLGWHIEAGLGRRPGAVDVQENWRVMPSAVKEFFNYYFSVVVKAAGGSIDKTRQLLIDTRRGDV